MKRAVLMSLAAPLALGACMMFAEDREPARRVEVVQIARVVSQPAGSVAATDGVTIHRDVIYGHHDGMANVYDVIKPANANGAAVLYMVSPASGWVTGQCIEASGGFKL